MQVLTLGRGQCVPWHHHTVITDTFFCLTGPMLVETRDPGARTRLECGGRLSVPPGCPHRVRGVDDGPCSFAIVQGVGAYDYSPEEPPPSEPE
ncbi:MAG: cupin domain-containing protein [bacterium]|nr:cupin domain-containing protein [bacterium]